MQPERIRSFEYFRPIWIAYSLAYTLCNLFERLHIVETIFLSSTSVEAPRICLAMQIPSIKSITFISKILVGHTTYFYEEFGKSLGTSPAQHPTEYNLLKVTKGISILFPMEPLY